MLCVVAIMGVGFISFLVMMGLFIREMGKSRRASSYDCKQMADAVKGSTDALTTCVTIQTTQLTEMSKKLGALVVGQAAEINVMRGQADSHEIGLMQEVSRPIINSAANESGIIKRTPKGK